MRTVLKILAKGIGFCAVMLVLSILVCLAAGLVEFSGEETKVSEVPQVYVVEPQELEQDGEGEESPDSVQDAEEQEATLLFAGDLFLTDLLQSKYNQQGISAAASDSLLSVLREADIFMLNEEFPFGTTGEPMEEKEYTFRVDPSYSTVLSELGVDIVTLANNHMLDFGRGPLTETLNTLDQAGIAHVGAGENIDEAKALKTFEMDGRTIGFLGASRVIPEHSWNASSGSSGLFTTYDAAALAEQIQKAEESCDFTVVYVHWGIEKNTQPEEYQKTLARQYIDAGADAVIGAHPHVLQGIEFYQGKPIFYSLGNFIFSNGAYETMLVELTVGGTETEIRLIPCVSEANQMRLLEESAWPAFYQNLESLSFGITIGDDGTVSQ
ncbi:hypothetical protein B5E77_12110 [Lachnoclostridium sp. An131]|uniref:CapA family protein n=1 Tax=Lachnoclostridium sp. An131 TaxID=1965555 RepID=UPI000B38D375|nr:CapA family protein [Lachnoclostridium sp. An131]OUQ25047.1 hypothetical protein B5E77_12110 [Lachnoclostridium sp. An131]